MYDLFFFASVARNENVGGVVTLPSDVIPPADRISILVELQVNNW
jgi:hypothetical protein